MPVRQTVPCRLRSLNVWACEARHYLSTTPISAGIGRANPNHDRRGWSRGARHGALRMQLLTARFDVDVDGADVDQRFRFFIPGPQR